MKWWLECRDNGERRQPCQGDCQHTSCSACRYVRPAFIDCATAVRCSSPADLQCLRRFGRCVRRQQCSRQWYPCNAKNRVCVRLIVRSSSTAEIVRDADETAIRGHARSSVVVPIDAALYDFPLTLNSNLISIFSRS